MPRRQAEAFASASFLWTWLRPPPLFSPTAKASPQHACSVVRALSMQTTLFLLLLASLAALGTSQDFCGTQPMGAGDFNISACNVIANCDPASLSLRQYSHQLKHGPRSVPRLSHKCVNKRGSRSCKLSVNGHCIGRTKARNSRMEERIRSCHLCFRNMRVLYNGAESETHED